MTGAALAIVAVAPLAAGVAYASRDEPEAPVAEVATGTAEVVRGTLSRRLQIGGMLGYAGSYAVGHRGAPGVLTAVPGPGERVGRGGILYRVADVPVRLLLGAVPAYRDFRYGMSDGPDVRQLEQNLVAMGFDPDRRITVDRHFGAATAAAIRRWERSWGRPAYRRTGRLTQAQVVFLPTPLRVTGSPVRPGATAGPDATVLTGTSTTPAVVAQLETADRGAVRAGDRVEVSLPGGGPVPGRVTSVGDVAAAPSEGPATVAVTVAVRLPRGYGLDQAPVTVDIVTDSRPGVLLVPVAALLARPGGGYQVRLAGGVPVPVEPGAFDDGSGQVEIVRGLTAGQTVEVPAS
ncbi:hypothetical protein Ade02nite_36140 [Paractinoplanes deccanensis]|uniref:Peptidoglycan binding-like domain-containing protein n=1 Tax=Paractinoplanes deccanensis TaxID=113561 RepID=A0ABQ3Y4R6_9ACTN|nr:hypothetical protein Ade02nite_36140 [Actinoplanes deccanensis]